MGYLLTGPLVQADCDLICTKQLSLVSLFPTLFDSAPIQDIVTLHCALFSIQYACAKSWLDSGLKVDRIIGHSFGQLTALCVAGSLPLSEALRLVSERARLVMKHCGPENGIMLAVEGSDIEHLLDLAQQQCQRFSADIACHNGPRNFVIAGDDESIQAIEKASVASQVTFRLKRLENTHAFHSRLLDSIIPDLLQVAGELHLETPVIPIEACCKEDDWSEITAEKIVQHTRMPVYFADAVRSVEQQMKGPIIWLEAGSGSPVIPMVRRAVYSQSSDNQHVYIPTSLQNSDAPINLVKATCRLWSSSVKAQFWPFHRSQRSSYNWINLPPYQFAKISHWLDYKPALSDWETPTVDSARSTSEFTELVRLVPEKTTQSEALFEINPRNELYQLSTKGHEVVDQTLCPASLYVEFILTASRMLTDAKATFETRICDLAMSSPLVLDPVGRVFLRLVGKESQRASWDFSIFSHYEQERDDPIIHSSGSVTISEPNTPSAMNRFQSLKSLILRRCNEIESSSASIGFKGPTVYKAMRPVVTYLDYYHGIRDIYSLDTEAVARVTLPPLRPSNLGTTFCDPVLTDSFTQVSGILANCFALEDDGEMWVCNFIGDITFTQRFIETARKEQSWIAYAKYEKPSPKRLQCDIFAFEPESGHLVFNITSIAFQKVSIKSLSKILGRLNSNKVSVQDVATKAPPNTSSDHTETKFQAYHTSHTATTHQPMQKQLPDKRTEATSNRSEALQKTKEMLGDVLEISLQEIFPDSILEGLGIDSLLAVEIFAEINKRFNISISHSEFATIEDVQGLAQLISPGLTISSCGSPSTSVSNYQNSTSTTSSSPASTSISTPVSGITDVSSVHQPVQSVTDMLSDVLEVPVKEILPDSSLENLGIDSLLAVEVFGEIKKRFNVSITHSDFATTNDVEGLAHLVCPENIPDHSLSPTPVSAHQPTGSHTPTQIDMETVIFGERDGASLSADIYYPAGHQDTRKPLPIGGFTHPLSPSKQ